MFYKNISCYVSTNPRDSFRLSFTIFFRLAEKVVEPNQKKYPWYHQQFRRVPTIDQCDSDDVVCDFEANTQFKRDRFKYKIDLFIDVVIKLVPMMIS